jgi:AcrR family transcriptional regulator
MTIKGGKRKTGRPTRRTEDTPTREKILAAAIDLFAERGYEGTSMRDIANLVGIRESAIYRHYAGKDAILQAIFAYAETRIYEPLPPAEPISQQDERSIFRDMLEGLPTFIQADPTLIKISQILLAEMHHDPKIMEYVQATYGEKAMEYTEALFRQQMKEGKIRSCDARALATIFNGFRFSWVYWTFFASHPSPEEVDRAEKDLRAAIELFEELLKPVKHGLLT